MRILLSYGLIGRGGDAIQLLEIADALHTLGHEVTFLGPHPVQPYNFSGARGHVRSLARRLPWWARDLIELGLDWRVTRQAYKYLQNQSFDLIFHRAGIYDTVGVRLAKILGCPLIVWLDAPFPIERAFRREGYFQNLHQRRMQELGHKAQRVVTVSRATKEYYVQLGLQAEKIVILPNGVSRQLLQKGAEQALKHRPFLRANECVLGFVGSLSRWHGVGLLLEAVHELLSARTFRWRVQIVGYGEEYAKLRAYAQKLKIEQVIEWFGAVPHERAFEQIAQFDIAVLPHTLPTGAPMKLFEYAALARPIIAPNLPNLRELFADDEICFIEPENPKALAEAMRWLSQHPQEATETGQRAQARVQRYCWEEMMQRLLSSLTP